jgi:hypothetical protein
MAAPHVAGAIALLQSAARRELGRDLTPAEVKRVLVAGAAPMTRPFAEQGGCDYLDGVVTGCDPGTCHAVSEALGCEWEDRPRRPYAPWQVGAGYLDVPGALRALHALARPAQERRPDAPAPAPAAPGPAPAPPATAPAPAPRSGAAPASKASRASRAKRRKASRAKRRKARRAKARKARRAALRRARARRR